MLGLIFGLVAALVAALGFGLVVELADQQDSSSTSPVISWRADRSYALVVGLTFGLGAALATVSGIRGRVQGRVQGRGRVRSRIRDWTPGRARVRDPGHARVRARGRALGRACLLAGLAIITCPGTACHALHTPLHLMAFPEDAHERNVLRTVGPVYQFRHARLQDRLAGASHGSGNKSETAGRLTHADNLPNTAASLRYGSSSVASLRW